MMKIAGVCFTQGGFTLLKQLQEILLKEGNEVNIVFKSRFAQNGHPAELKEDLKDWTRKRFIDSDAIIFVGATGITVRTIAPFVRDKRQDPAIIVLDERGKFCIPLLSGHIGGANELAGWLAEQIHAVPVVTTATDAYGKFAVDVYATQNHMTLSNMTYAKEVSASLLSGYPVGFQSDFPVTGDLPEGIVWAEELKPDNPEEVTLGISISPSYQNKYFDHCLWLIPPCITVGIGCRKGSSAEQIEKLFHDVLKEHYIYPEAVCQVATIDLKADEPGLLEFCEKNHLPLITYTPDELRRAEGSFLASEFVEDVTGVDNVCERSAALAGEGEVIVRKTCADGVTCACVKKDWRICFE
ncbi:cobalt-precorrin 5A hydrolase [Novisyntrophococcus fermenticellae]|uniref:cobalt-precorrin 5A hydrolase n=1 Tax=Novisyntrophococcus fermenticellae TaxID=2068655 RepID=UPI001E6106FA|nr:cobalt-precorrin 5A hydrolase [Novisyntrophococcus fermenticellae]